MIDFLVACDGGVFFVCLLACFIIVEELGSKEKKTFLNSEVDINH